MKTLRLAIIGAGTWGETHAGIFAEHPSAINVAVCDKNETKAAAVAKKYGINEIYSD